ncbi:uncharacterized protein BDZ99DRAFT_458767 [Mytilinidion resinicola]|uniref:Uncharacterized protein n=1 Tax=Mytilinidion resinicola TaxID=574789 RepID=A0A6A6Z0U6_9PEZI|nr:uncharacterized protein BDZ99DRAFT_458767 [Mytilinidion resinicola]KAF2814786.1 hypothetical protein BDZ99DRAFT_458767 [Mytilinidion resinicola]
MQIDHRGGTKLRRMRRVHRQSRMGHDLCLCRRMLSAENETGTEVDGGLAADAESRVHGDRSAGRPQYVNEDGGENEMNSHSSAEQERTGEEDREDRLTADGYGSEFEFEFEVHHNEEYSYTESDYGETDSVLSIHGWSDDEAGI